MVGRPSGRRGRPTTAATTASTLKPPALLGFDEIGQGVQSAWRHGGRRQRLVYLAKTLVAGVLA